MSLPPLPNTRDKKFYKDVQYQQAFAIPKKGEAHWMEAVKEAEALHSKTKDERITYMKIKYPLVKYKESALNGCLVPNEKVNKNRKGRELGFLRIFSNFFQAPIS